MGKSKEVFALRKAGNLEEAYTLGKAANQEDPEDEWVVKALGWVLYDKIKTALQDGKQQEANIFISEAKALDIKEDDKVLFEQLQKLFRKASPDGQKLQQARALEEQGNYHEALTIFRQVKPLLHLDPAFNESYGWCLYRCIKHGLEKDNKSVQAEESLLYEYLDLITVRPSNLHSNILRQAKKLAENRNLRLVPFFLNWGTKSFQREDWEKNLYNEKVYPGLAEKVIQHVSKEVLTNGSVEDIESLIPALEDALQKIKDNIWLYYYHSKLLLKIGKKQEAEQLIIPVLKEKRTEYWVWIALGDIYRATSINKAISCYCKGLLCGADEKFLTKSRLTMGQMLYEKGYLPEAKTEFLKSRVGRENNNYPIGQELPFIEGQPWFSQTKETGDNKPFYEKHKEEAEAVLHADLPWINGTSGEIYAKPDNPKDKRLKVFFKAGVDIEETSIKEMHIRSLGKTRPGEPIRLKAEKLQERWQVYTLERRPEGEAWDTFPQYIGVIDHINSEKQICHFIADTKVDGILRGNQISNPKVGDYVKVRIKTRIKDKVAFYEVLKCESTLDKPPSQICRNWKGTLTIREGNTFGFIGDIFLDPMFIKKNGLEEKNGEEVAVQAVKTFNKSKGNWGWKAINLSLHDESEPIPPKESMEVDFWPIRPSGSFRRLRW